MYSTGDLNLHDPLKEKQKICHPERAFKIRRAFGRDKQFRRESNGPAFP
jgi:hypothetical protein